MEELLSYIEQIHPRELFLDSVYPAPAANQELEDYSNLSLVEIKKNLSLDEIWRVGLSFLKRGNTLEAIQYFKLYLKRDASNPRIIASLGFCYLILNEYEKAIKIFNKALTKDHNLIEVRLWLVFAKIKEQNFKSAKLQINKIKDQINNAAKLILDLYIALASSSEKQVKKAYENLETHSNLQLVAEIIVLYEFFKGRKLLNEGDVISACRIWNNVYSKYQEEWHKHKIISQYLFSLSSGKLHFLSLRKNDSQYLKVIEKLLHLQLIPEFFEEESALNERLEYWKSKITEKGSYPYANFRHALCLSYLGKISEAYERFLECRDKIPASKVSFFKIDELIDWTRDPEFKPEANEEGWDPSMFYGDEIQEWKDQGFDNPVIAKRWKNLGANALEAKSWELEFKTAKGLSFAYYAAGFKDPKIAIKWAKYFSVPTEAWECYSQGNQIDEFGRVFVEK